MPAGLLANPDNEENQQKLVLQETDEIDQVDRLDVFEMLLTHYSNKNNVEDGALKQY